MNQVLADVGDDGVSVPPADAKDVPELRQVIADAREHGIDLKIVVIATNPPIDTPL
ncbi:MAG: Rv1476 family membrane protein, partial [Mycobacterium sp.]